MRFLEYLATRRASFTVQGDFVRFALSDPQFPDAKSWEEIDAYLSQATASHLRLHRVAAEAVWESYLDKLGSLNAR